MGVGLLDDAGRSAEGGAVPCFLKLEHFLIARFQLVPDRLFKRLDIGLGNDSFGDELLLVGGSECRTLGDFLGNDRLGECRLVRLVVALATIAIHVDDDIPAKLLAELEREQGGPVEFHRLLAVDVKDGSVDHLRDVGRVIGRTRVGRRRGETDLVVDDEVDRPAGPVALELGKVEDLGHRSLAREGRVAVKQDGQHLVAVDLAAGLLTEYPLTRAGLALDDGIHRFKVARICRQAEANLAVREFAHALVAEVVFHITVTSD